MPEVISSTIIMVPHEEHSPLQHTGLGEGRIEIICGPMFSGKTEELLRRVRRAQIAHQPTVILKIVGFGRVFNFEQPFEPGNR